MRRTLGMATTFIVFIATVNTSAAPRKPAQNPPEKPKSRSIDLGRVAKIVYASVPWNLDSTRLDSAFLFMRDAKTNRLIKVFLEETEPDSSTFSGTFAISWAAKEEISPEVYIPPQNSRNDTEAVSQFSKLINEGKIKKQPVVYTKGDKGQIVIDVYDTREQAKRALDAYLEKRKLQDSQNKLTPPATTKPTLELAESTARAILLKKLAAEAASQAAERVRIEQLEKQRAEERKKKAEALAAGEREKRRQLAAEKVKAAMVHYEKGEFNLTQDLFREATELDPGNKEYYFKYGVTLYRSDKLNEAVVVLKLAETEGNTELEKKYYLGLIHYRLKEFEEAKKYFADVKTSKVDVLAPSSAFYEGIILFGEEKYDASKSAFELVLDTSNDPQMDQRAEEYIEKIADIQRFQAMARTKHIGSFTVGVMYDDNILYAPDGVELQGTSVSNKGGARALLSTDYQYRFVFNRDREFAARLTGMTLYSVDSEFAKADPLIVNTSTPYSWKGNWGTKGYKFSVIPAYEMLMMDPEGTNYPGGVILSSPMLRLDLTLIMSQNWFANYFTEMRHDDSIDPASTGDVDADAPKVTLRTSHTFFLEKDKKTALIVNGGYVHNEALGIDRRYQRIEMGAVFTAPFRKWDASWMTGLSGYLLDYPVSTDSRNDRNVSFTLGINKPVMKDLIWSVTGNYINNTSTTDTFQYSKFTVLSSITYRLNQ